MTTHTTEIRAALLITLLIMAVVTIAFIPNTINVLASILGLVAGIVLGALSGGRSA